LIAEIRVLVGRLLPDVNPDTASSTDRMMQLVRLIGHNADTLDQQSGHIEQRMSARMATMMADMTSTMYNFWSKRSKPELQRSWQVC